MGAWSNFFCEHLIRKVDSIFAEHFKIDKQMFVKHLPPARSEYRVPQRPITKTGTKEGQLTQRYY